MGREQSMRKALQCKETVCHFARGKELLVRDTVPPAACTMTCVTYKYWPEGKIQNRSCLADYS